MHLFHRIKEKDSCHWAFQGKLFFISILASTIIVIDTVKFLMNISHFLQLRTSTLF